AGVDDGTVQGGLEPDLGLHEVGARGELETGVIDAGSDPDPTGSCQDLPSCQEGDHRARDLVEGDVAVEQEILVGAVGGALADSVVLVQCDVRDPVGPLEDLHRPAGDQLSGAVCDDGFAGPGGLRGGVLGVGVVDVPAGAVAQHGIADRAVGGPGEHAGVVPLRG